MSQHDYSIANQGFPATRSDINNVLSAISTNNSGTAAPSSQFAGQFWIDTTSSTWTLYIHDGSDDIQFATIDTSANTVNFTDSALDVVTDTTPQLGGDLNLNSNDITGTGNINNVGTITTDGLTVAGNVSVDGGSIKLDGNYPTGTANVALGNAALGSGSLSGDFNTAVGDVVLTNNTSGHRNVAIGYNALTTNTTGYCNNAIGQGALNDNTTGINNVAVGTCALKINTTGGSNTAVGKDSLKVNTTGAENVAVGALALDANTTASEITAIGYAALTANTTGYNNTAIGRCSLTINTTGFGNTGLGNNAGMDVTTGDNNVLVGYNSGRTSSPFNVTTQDGRMVLGNNTITNAYVRVAWTVTSDQRDKMNIESVPHGLDFINKLNPIKYNFKKSREDDTPHGNARYGFKAQDILALEGDNPVIIDDEQPDHLKYNGEALVPVLVNAIKELKTEIELLKNK